MGYDKKAAGESKPALDLFMILGNILVDKDTMLCDMHVNCELFHSVFSPYMIIRYLSMNGNPSVRNAVLSHLTTLEGLADKPELLYRLLLTVIPRTGNRFTPYIKSGFVKSAHPIDKSTEI